MRSHSLQLGGGRLLDSYRVVTRAVDSITLKESYLANVDRPASAVDQISLARIDEQMEFIAARGAPPELSVLLFGMISFLDKRHAITPDVLQEMVQNHINDHATTRELLIQDGTWDVRLSFNEGDFRFPKYDYELKEIVPESIIEIFQSVALCLQNGLNIAALSLALVALETTLWDYLATKGIKKQVQTETYPHSVLALMSWEPVEGYRLSITDENHAPKVPGAPVTFEVAFYRTGPPVHEGGKTFRILRAKVEDQFSLLLSDDTDMVIRARDAFGLAVALQRARKEGLLAWDEGLDETFQILRNRLIHQEVDYEDIEIYTPNGTIKLGEVSQKPELTLFFINRIQSYISDAYYTIRLEYLAAL
jgi:hypothetical protein